ncbi:TPA: hypothetical protein KNH08_004062 [Serratia fonticola]|nr:hypothetical protein [Serratia fonticola]
MKKKYWFAIVVLFCLVVINLYQYFLYNRVSHMTCQGEAVIKNDRYVFKALFSLSLAGDVGLVLVNGELIDREGTVSAVHRSSSFEFTQHGKGFYITNSSVAVLPNDTAGTSQLNKLLPPYLLINDINARFAIYPIADDGYLIASPEYVHLYCKKLKG